MALSRKRVAREELARGIGERRPARVLEYGPADRAVSRLENYLPVDLSGRPPLGSEIELRIDGARTT